MGSAGETNYNSSLVEMTTLNSGRKAKVKWDLFLATNRRDRCAASAHRTLSTLLEEPRGIFIAGAAILPRPLWLPTKERCSVSTKNNTSSIQAETMA